MNLLFNLVAVQPIHSAKFHGGGSYGEVIFWALVKRGAKFSCAYDSRKYLDPAILDACKQKDIPLFDISVQTPQEIIDANQIDTFYTPLYSLTMAFALAACGDDSSTGGGSGNGDNPENPESSGSQDPSNLSSSIEWILPNDPSKLWTGEGTEANPYELKNEEDILTLANEVNNQAVNFNGVAFKLTADVSLSKNWTPIGCVKGQSNRTFGGIFDGGDHTIKGLSIDDTASFSGLFGYISGAKIKNVKVDGASIKAGSYVGILFGKAENAEIANVSVSGTLQGADFVGGLGGSISKGNVETASVSGTVSGTGTVGGVIATAISSTIKSANNGAAVTGKTTVAGCVATLSMKSTVELCVNKGNIAGTQDVAGVVAKASEATVKQSLQLAGKPGYGCQGAGGEGVCCRCGLRLRDGSRGRAVEH